MRFDRMLTLGFFGPLGRTGIAGNGRSLPVLMYHSISDTKEAGTSPYFKVCTSPARFAEQMACLAAAGWKGVSLREGLETLDHAPNSSLRPVAITFDDGFRDFYTAAFPILKCRGFSATMYLPTASIGETSLEFKGRPCMTWSEVAELHQQGIEFGSHTVNHPVLHGMPFAQIEAELALSRRRIEDALGSECRAFAYPYAFPQADASFAKAFTELLGSVGYKTSVTTIVGRVKNSDNRLTLRRLPVNDADDWTLLEAKLQGAYDWLSVPQAISKKARWWIRSRGTPSTGKVAQIPQVGSKT
jgi:peptidoglycan/xylan/chitin deacetylase (PgdA/CDA1 family)